MKWAYIGLLVASTFFGGSGGYTDSASKNSFAVINFAPSNVNEPCPQTDYKIYIELEASNGKKYTASWKAGGQVNMGSVLCDRCANYLKNEDWSYERNGDRLLITAVTDEKQRTSQIVKISIRTENFPVKMTPRIVASPTVKVVKKEK